MSLVKVGERTIMKKKNKKNRLLITETDTLGIVIITEDIWPVGLIIIFLLLARS